MPTAFQIRAHLFLLPIADHADSRAVKQLLEQAAAIECLSYLPAPNADIWQFRFQNADLIVCNPPWLPAKPTSAVETALYDPGHAMLRGFLSGARQHLNDGGEIWLVMSDLAEHLGLRTADFLPALFQTASLALIETLHTLPVHAKATDPSDPLAFARSRETTTLYRLRPL